MKFYNNATLEIDHHEFKLLKMEKRWRRELKVREEEEKETQIRPE